MTIIFPYITPGKDIQVFPASFAQQRLWFLEQLTAGTSAYNLLFAIELEGVLNVPALEQSLTEIVQRHEILRTTFATQNGLPVQIITPTLTVPLATVDLRNVPETEREAETQRLATEEAGRPFDLGQGPLLRATLLQMSECKYLFFLAVHHIVFDSWSSTVFMRELVALYESITTGKPLALNPLPIQYADFTARQQQWLQGEVLETELAYWREQLAGAPAMLDLPTDRPRPASPSSRSSLYVMTLPTELAEALKTLSRQQDTTLYITLVAAFQTLLYRYSGQEDLILGTVASGRTQVETEPLIGFFVNTLVLRTDLSGNPTFSELLRRVREVVLQAHDHQEVPFDYLVKELQPERTWGRNPLFQVFLALDPPPSPLPPGWMLNPIVSRTETSMFDLSLELNDRSEGIVCHFEYSTELFDEATIARMAGHWQTLLQGIVADPSQHIAELPFLTEEERHQVLVEWNATQAKYPKDQCVHQLFEAQVERTPEAIAVVYDEQKLTYHELNQRANRLAHYLRRLGVGPDVLVGLCVERSPEMLVGLLAVLKAGGTYVPMDPTYPRERLAFMVEDTNTPLLVTRERLVDTLPAQTTRIVRLDADWSTIEQESADNLPPAVTPDNLVYVIYTSGSTGKPKGVLVSHYNLIASTMARMIYYEEPITGYLLLSSFAFDSSVAGLFWTLCQGGALILPHSETQMELAYLAKLIVDNQVSHLLALPSLYGLILEQTPVEQLASLRTVIVAGEACSKELVERHYALLNQAMLFNEYGPTEATVWCSVCRCEPHSERALVSIGRPIANAQLYLLDAQQQPVPIGVPGEIYVGGAGITRGYLHRPELTKERFIAHPFSDVPGARLYKTGDLARYRTDGLIEFLGRLDHQVKIRGFRIELGEIETVLSQHSAVQQAVVVVREDVPGDKRLVAYVVAQQGQVLEGQALRSYLQAKLPSYMIPAAFVFLETLPLLSTGKIDRRALPVPDYAHSGASQQKEGPRTPLEAVVAQAWSQTLGMQSIDIHEDFFMLGGHSLLAMQVISRLRTSLQVELSLRSFFEAPTIAQLAQQIGQLQADATAASLLPPITAVSRQSYRRPISSLSVGQEETGVEELVVMPASLSQQGLWLVHQLEPESPAYNVPMMLRLGKPLDMAALEHSLQALLQRHETLRTTFALMDDQPMQIIAPSLRVPLRALDLTRLAAEQQEAEVQRLLFQEMQQPFDLARGPLLRMTVLQRGAQEHLVLLFMHHIISDGWSMDLLSQELVELYQAWVTRRSAHLEPLPIQYADFALWQRQWVQGERLDEQLSYWKETLAGAPPVLDLPTDHPRPTVPTQRGAGYGFTLPAGLSEALQQLSRQEGVTLYMTLVAGFVALLQRYSGQDDLVIGTTSAGRRQQETKDLIGYFVNTLVLRTDLTGNPSVRELLARVRETVLGAHAHQEVPFAWLVRELQPERSLSRHPLFQVMLTLDPPASPLAPAWEAAQMRIPTVANKFDLSLELSEQAEGLAGYLEYSSDLFEESTIHDMMAHWQRLLEAMVVDAEQPVAQLPLLTDREQQQLLVEWNTTQQSVADKWVPQLFEEQVVRTPQALALVCDQQQLTYRELNVRANQLAHHLQQMGVGPEVLVGLCVERSLEMIVGVLGILKAGGVYVPLDPEYPQERLSFLLQDTQMPVLLTQEHLLSRFAQQQVQLVCLDRDRNAIAQQSTANPSRGLSGEQGAYVIYTSGSTGQPKGVLITHRALAAHCWSMAQVYELGPQDRVLQFSNFTFDASLEQILPTLLVGARLVLRGPEVWSPAQLLKHITEAGLSVINLPTAYWQQVAQEWRKESEGLFTHCLRLVIVGGERLLPEALHLWRQTPFRAVRLLNAYGPTETVITATLYDTTAYTGGNTSGESVPIGRPLPNRKVYILDRWGARVPMGVPGELHIGGALLARGYLHRPDLTAERFIADPFSSDPHARLYKTGDRARYRADGTIEFLGRLDEQVKIRGFRIEVGEIESVLSQHPEVREAVVVAREETPGDKRLVAYVVAQQGQVLEGQALRSYLQAKLPSYMIPATFVFLETLPLLSTGKIDRHALPAPKLTKLTEEETFVAPRLLIHQQLMQIWEELLDVRPIGIRDNFFYLGGHSLLAARFVDRIEHIFGKRFALSRLFSGPTIEQLAEALQQQEKSDARTSVLPVQVGGSKRPFFFLHGDWTGGAFYCFALARAFGPDQPFYVLEPYKFGGLQTLPSMEEVAAAHIESMRTIQPKGPYLLGGFCNGGLLAYEMARQLQAAGECIDLLALINPSVPGEFDIICAMSKYMGKLLRFEANKQANLFLRMHHTYRHVYRTMYPSRFYRRRPDFNKLLAIDPRLEKMFPPVEALYNDYVSVFTWLVSRYETGIYPGKITFFWASEEEPFIEKTWLPVTGAKDSEDIENHIVPGTHMSCVTEHIEDLAECLSTCVSRIQEEALNQQVGVTSGLIRPQLSRR